jgi:hypothetical protein
MFKRTVGVSCSLKESIDGLEIIICGKMRMQQYVIFNVLKEYCMPKEEEDNPTPLIVVFPKMMYAN